LCVKKKGYLKKRPPNNSICLRRERIHNNASLGEIGKSRLQEVIHIQEMCHLPKFKKGLMGIMHPLFIGSPIISMINFAKCANSQNGLAQPLPLFQCWRRLFGFFFSFSLNSPYSGRPILVFGFNPLVGSNPFTHPK